MLTLFSLVAPMIDITLSTLIIAFVDACNSRILHLHIPVHTSMFLRHLQRIVPQPFNHWHEIISMQAFGTGSIVIKIGESLPSVMLHPYAACKGCRHCICQSGENKIGWTEFNQSWIQTNPVKSAVGYMPGTSTWYCHFEYGCQAMYVRGNTAWAGVCCLDSWPSTTL